MAVSLVYVTEWLCFSRQCGCSSVDCPDWGWLLCTATIQNDYNPWVTEFNIIKNTIVTVVLTMVDFVQL